MKGDLEIRARGNDWRSEIEFVIKKSIDGKRYVAEPIMMKEVEPNMAIPYKSILSIGIEEAQVLMDDLWHCGLRPSEGSGSAGALAATQRHLDDMRELVFKFDTRKKG